MDDGGRYPVAAAAAAPDTTAPTVAIAVETEQQKAAPPQLPEDEVALVRAFGAHGLVKQALRRRSQELKGTRGGARGTRIPNTLRAIERRWFVGRQTVQKATEKTNELRPALAAGVAESDALIGTATLLALAAEGSGLVTLISARGGPAEPFCELRLCVKSPQRGGGFTRKMLDHKAYYVHQDVVSACRQHAEQHCQLQALRQEGREPRLETALPTQLLPTSQLTFLDEPVEALSPAAPDWTADWVSQVDLSSNDSYDISDGSPGDSDIDFASIGSVSDQDELGPASLWEEQYQDDRWSTDDLTATSVGTGSEQDIDSLTSMSDDDAHGFPETGTGAVSASYDSKRDWGQHWKRPHEQLFDEDDEKLFESTAQQRGADTYEKRTSPHTRRKTGPAAAGTFLATAALALMLLVVHHSRPRSTTSDDSLISPVRPAMVWTLEGVDTSIGLFQGGERNKCVSPASVTQMCEASGQTSGRTCVMQNAAANMWPRWRQQNPADALPDVVTACGQLGGATPLLPALSRRLAVKGVVDGLNCRVKWGARWSVGPLARFENQYPTGLSAAAITAGLRHTTGLRSSGGIIWTTDHHVRLYLFASAYPCRLSDTLAEDSVSIGACGMDITEEDTIEIYGDTVGGVWSYNLLSGSEEGWTRQSNSEIRAASVARINPELSGGSGGLLVQNRRTLPPARNNAVQWSFPSGSVFILGGSGCTTEPRGGTGNPGDECVMQDLSDLWYWDAGTGLWSCLYMPEPTTGASSVVPLHYQEWSAENGGLPDGNAETVPKSSGTPEMSDGSSADPASGVFVEGVWPVARRGRSAWTTCDDDDASDCELWLFGGEIVGSGAVQMTGRNIDGSDYRSYDFGDDGDKKVVQMEEVAPVDSLWRYSVQGGPGSWKLVSGWDDGTLCRMSTPSKSTARLCRGVDVDGQWAEYANTILMSAAVPVDPCAHVWPVDRDTGEFVRFADSHCPPSRYAAAAWADSRPGAGGWVFGGLNSMKAGVIVGNKYGGSNTIIGLGLGDEIHDDELTETLIQTMLVDNQGPDGWGASMMFDDLWHFNGDAVKPRWLRVPRPAGVSEWPIAGAGRGWTDSSQLWLSMGEPSEQWPSSYGRSYGGRLLPAQIWAFSVDAETWERVDRDVTRGPEWPAARRGELLDGGWLFGGMGGAECSPEKAQPSNLPAPVARELEGLWRWGKVGPGTER